MRQLSAVPTSGASVGDPADPRIHSRRNRLII